MNIENKVMEYSDEIEEKRMFVTGLMLSMHGIEKLLHPVKLIKYKFELGRLDKIEFSLADLNSKRYNSDERVLYEEKIIDFIEKNPINSKKKLIKCKYC